MHTRISDKTLRLRAVELTDVDRLYRWENSPEAWVTGCIAAPLSHHQLWDYVQNYDADPFAAKQLRLMAEILDPASDSLDSAASAASVAVIGAVDLYDFSPRNRTGYVGVIVDPRYRGCGYAGAALAVLERYASETLGIRTLAALVAVDNGASVALFSSARYERVGLMKQWLRRPQGFSDVAIFQKNL